MSHLGALYTMAWLLESNLSPEDKKSEKALSHSKLSIAKNLTLCFRRTLT